jgi:signal transduction histidine kinase
MLNRATDLFVSAVSRSRASVHTKLLVAFVGIVALLIGVMVLALSLLAASNTRVQDVGVLQAKSVVYQNLKTNADQVRRLLALRAGGNGAICYSQDSPNVEFDIPNCKLSANSLLAIDQNIATILGQFVPGTNESRFGFQPSSEEHDSLHRIRESSTQLSNVIQQMTDYDKGGEVLKGLALQHEKAEGLSNSLGDISGGLVSSALSQTQSVQTENRTALDRSLGLFIAVAAAATILALLLGYILSRSVVGPIKQIELRLSEITAGDFSGHVDVRNRDELGSLAANINLMNNELGRLYKELESASRHKSEFLASMSHELRTPLNAIIGFSQVLRQQMFGELNPKQTEYLDDILSSGQHLLNLINDILDLAKVEAGRMDLQPATFQLDEILRNATAMVRERAIRQDVTLNVGIDKAIGEIEADERKVKQILFNLLSNAVKFTPGGGSVTLAAAIDGHDAVISVRDTGVGISAEDQSKIFEEFSQLGPGMAQEGTGLGLALTKRLVELHGGVLSVESAPGEGSTFTARLPLSRAASAPAPELVQSQEPVSA